MGNIAASATFNGFFRKEQTTCLPIYQVVTDVIDDVFDLESQDDYFPQGKTKNKLMKIILKKMPKLLNNLNPWMSKVFTQWQTTINMVFGVTSLLYRTIYRNDDSMLDIADEIFDEFNQVYEHQVITPKYSYDWGMIVKAKKHVNDEETSSFNTEVTDALSEEQPENDLDDCDYWSCSGSDASYDSFDMDEVTEPEKAAAQLIRLSSCSSNFSIDLDDYICTCGECPQYKQIVKDVATSSCWINDDEKNSLIRLLHAFSTYNEVIGYNPDMITCAEHCLVVSDWDEQEAFTAFVILQDEIDNVCAHSY
jgi:hypothetical protein